MPNGKLNQSPTVRRAALLSAVALLASLGFATSPGEAGPRTAGNGAQKPTIDQVRSTLDKLDREAEIVSEDLNAVRVQMGEAQKRLGSLRADVSRQRSSTGALRRQIIGSTLSDYQNAAGLSTATSFLVADDPATFMTQLADDAVAERQQTDALTELVQAQQQLTIRERQARTEFDAIRADKVAITEHKAALAHKSAQAQDLLSTLRAQQRARLLALQRRQQRQARRARQAQQASPSTAPTGTLASQPSRDTSRVSTRSVPTSSRAQVAVATALAQVGDPYVYGAAGPDAFDCSGLTMYAWAAAGVSIPHASSMQPGAGSPVAISDLMPGDLVFYYSPISHVAMYIGNGQVVHAPHTGSYVQVVPLDSMPIAMAVRIG